MGGRPSNGESGPFGDAWNCAIEECRDAVRIAGASASNKQAAKRYAALVEGLKLRDPARRGSGMLTAIASVGLLWCEPAPEEAMRIAANELGTDTDTIATMAGALLGATADAEPPIDVLDAELFRSEADRLTKIAHGGKPERHQYPDLLRWTAPGRRADTLVCTRDGGLYVRGLGPAKVVSDPESSSRGDFQWQWLALESGQTLLIKRRMKLMCVNEDTESLPAQRSLASMSSNGDGIAKAKREPIDQRPKLAPRLRRLRTKRPTQSLNGPRLWICNVLSSTWRSTRTMTECSERHCGESSVRGLRAKLQHSPPH